MNFTIINSRTFHFESHFSSEELGLIALAWERYKILGEVLVDLQGRGATVLFYFTIMIPFGLGVRLFSDPLRLKQAPHWLNRDPISTSIEEARRQG